MNFVYSFIKESNIKYSKNVVLNNIKDLSPCKFNKFYWWRLYTDNVVYLSKKTPLYQRIINGDFNPSSYLWQAQLTLHKAKEKLNLQVDDHEKQIEILRMDILRYNKLMEDFEKEENFRLSIFYESFCKKFSLTKEQINDILLTFDGTILDLYKHLKTQ